MGLILNIINIIVLVMFFIVVINTTALIKRAFTLIPQILTDKFIDWTTNKEE
jgi:hypothetical protein